MTSVLAPPSPSWRREFAVAVTLGSALFLVSLVPYLLAQANAPTGRTFNGFFFIADDAATYVAKMREGADGAWGWRDPYISRPLANPVLLFFFYIAWGKLAALIHVSMYVGYHLARLSGAIALVGGARRLARECLAPGRPQRVALVLAMGGSGIGWTLQLFAAVSGLRGIGGQPLEALELHLPELSGFYSILAVPHFAWAAALMAFALVSLLGLARPSTGSPAGRLAVATLCLVGLCLIHPQMLFVLAPLAAFHLLLTGAGRRAWRLTAAPFVVCGPLLAYFLWILAADPVVVAWAHQWRHQAPALLGLVFALGLPLALSGVAATRWRLASPALRVMMGWVALVFLVLYLPNPVNIQRRLIDGIYLPVAILAASGLEVLIQARAQRRRGWFRTPGPIALAAVGLSLVMSVLVWSVAMTAAVGREPIIYLDTRDLAAIEWLSTHHPPGLAPAVLSHPLTGLYIPARSGYRVYVGHYSETIDYLAKSGEAFEAYRGGATTTFALARREGAAYVFLGTMEQAVAGDRAATGELAGADLVYDRDGVRLYRLREAGSRPTGARDGQASPG